MSRPTPIDRLLATRTAALVAATPLALAGDVSGVHQARVASRRLREVIPVTGRDAALVRRARLAVREVTRALGPIRELDVCLGRFEPLAASQALSPVAALAVRGGLTTRRGRAWGAARRAVTASRQRRLARLLGVLSAAPPTDAASVQAGVAARVAGRAGRVLASLEALGVLYDPVRLHAVRIAVKQLRYAYEVLDELRRGRTGTTLRQLKALQDLLGDAHDLHVLDEHVRRAEVRVVSRSRAAARELRQLSRTLERTCRALHASFTTRRPALARLATALSTGQPWSATRAGRAA